MIRTELRSIRRDMRSKEASVPSGWVSARTLHPKSSPTGRVISLGEAFSITLGISMCTIPDLGFLDSHSRLCAQTCDDFVNEMSEMGGQG